MSYPSLSRRFLLARRAGLMLIFLSFVSVVSASVSEYAPGKGPIVDLGPDTSVCDGSFLVFNAGPGFTSYLWSTGAITQTITASVQGYYFVTVTDAIGDTAVDSVYLTVIPLPNDFTLGPDTVICTGFSVLLDAGPGFDIYLWQDGSITQTIVVSDAGIYSVSVSGECGIAADSILLTEIPLPAVSLGADRQLCTGQSVLLDPGSIYVDYLWNNGDTVQTQLVNTTGSYAVTVTDTNSCVGFDAMTLVVQDMPVVALGAGSDMCNLRQTMLDAGSGVGLSSYLWQDGSVYQTYLVKTDGLYSVTVTNSCGTVTGSVVFEPCPDCLIELPNAFSPNGDGNNDVLYPVGGGYTRINLIIYNRHGEKVYETNELYTGWDGTYKGELQPNEVYYYYLTGECLGGKVVKKKGDVTLLK
jgi:gliding motility-associated-like protein